MGSIEAYHSISEMIGAGFSDSRNGRRGVLEIRGSLLGGGAALITDDGLAVAAALIVGDAHEKDVIVDALPMTGAAFRGGAFRGGASRVVPSKKPCDVSGVGSQSRRIDGSGGAASNIICFGRRRRAPRLPLPPLASSSTVGGAESRANTPRLRDAASPPAAWVSSSGEALPTRGSFPALLEPPSPGESRPETVGDEGSSSGSELRAIN